MTAQEYAQALYDALHEVNPDQHDIIIDNFANILHQNGDLAKYPEIETAYQQIEQHGGLVKQAHVTTASDLDPHELLKDLNRIVGSHVTIKHSVDDSLVGGVVVRVDDTLIDGSIKHDLKALRTLIEREN